MENQKFKKCYLHIGSEKTGTTSLQEFLRLNRRALGAQGFFIPRSMGRTEHIDLVCLFANDDKRFSRRTSLGVKTPESVEAHKEVLNSRIGEELSNAASADLSLVISTERLLTQINEPNEIAALRSFLLTYCEEVEVVVYIRPQHEFARSIFTTKLRGGKANAECFPEIDASEYQSRFYYYDTILDFWQQGFPDSTVTVRRFERAQLVDGDSVADFCDVLSIDANNLEAPSILNPSLSAEAQIFLQQLNPHLAKLKKRKAMRARSHVNRVLEDRFTGSGMLPSRSSTEAFYEQFADSNENTRRVWFPNDEQLFNPSFDKYPDVADDSEELLSSEQAFEIFAEILKDNTRTIQRLRKRVAAAEAAQDGTTRPNQS